MSAIGPGTVPSAGAAAALVALLLGPPAALPAAAAAVSSVQKGTLANSTSGTQPVPIAVVDASKSFLLFQTRHNSARPVGSMVRGRIASPTSLEFVRVTDEGSAVPINLEWSVVSFSSGVKVQRGAIGSQNATTLNVTISPVASTSQAFVAWSKTPASTDATFNIGKPR